MDKRTVAVRVWDVPTRLFHWLLLVCVGALFATGLTGGGWILWHERIAYFTIGLLLFRLIWGLVGGRTARFADFVRGPSAILRYVKTGASPTLGHNPLGALSVLALLAALLVQGATGLIIDDEIATQGPLAHKVPSAWVSLATTIHRINKWVIGVLVAMHVLAILYYQFVRKERLVRAMISGVKEVDPSQAQPDVERKPIAALVVALVVVAFVYWLVVIYPK